MGKEKLVFVDHTFHIKSRSGDFLRKIFKQHYKIINIWVDKKLNFDKKIYDHENIFFFQIFPPLSVLNKLKNKNLMWAPMYDSPHHPIGFSKLLWKIVEYHNIKVLSFSKKLTKQILNYNISYLDLKYYVKPTKFNDIKKKKITIFFWYRGDIDYRDWSKSINLKEIEKIIFFDTQSKNRSHEFKKNKKILYLHKPFSKQKIFKRLLSKADVFVCPRYKEGIGMANVEALSFGKYLISNNDATMSEYIKNNKIGIFFNKPINNKLIPNKVIKYQNYRFNEAVKGFLKFKSNEESIIKLLQSKNKNKNSIFPYFILLFIFKTYALKRKILMFFR